MEITAQQYKLIEPLLPVPRGNVKISHLQVLNAVLYVAEHGCKWRGLPKKFGSSRFSGEGGLDFQEEVLLIPVTVGHALDDLDLVIDPFKLAGMHREFGTGEDAAGVAPEISGEVFQGVQAAFSGIS